jgi:uncharacterized membrane protein
MLRGQPEEDRIMTEPNPYSDATSQAGPGTTAPPANGGTTEPRTVDAGQGWNWIAQGWDLFKKKPGIWIANTVIILCLNFLSYIVPLVGHIAFLLFLPVLIGGLMLGCRAMDHGEELEVAHLFAGFKENTSQLVMVGVAFVVTGMLILLVVVMTLAFAGAGTVLAMAIGGNAAAMLVGGAFAILSVAVLLIAAVLLIPLLMAIWFAAPLVALRGIDAMDALRLSFSASVKNIAPFLVYSIIGFVLCLLAIFPGMVVALVVLLPVLIASIYTSYRDIFQDA